MLSDVDGAGEEAVENLRKPGSRDAMVQLLGAEGAGANSYESSKITCTACSIIECATWERV